MFRAQPRGVATDCSRDGDDEDACSGALGPGAGLEDRGDRPRPAQGATRSWSSGPPPDCATPTSTCRSSEMGSEAGTGEGRRGGLFPMVGGHEGGGVVLEVGPGRRQPPSPATTWPPASSPSAAAARCASPATPTCATSGAATFLPRARSPTGPSATTWTARRSTSCPSSGTFAEHGVVHEASLVAVDADLPLGAVALVSCGVATGWGSAVYRAEVMPGDTVVVVGVGGVGINAVQGAQDGGGQEHRGRGPGGVQAEVGPRLRCHPHGRVHGRGPAPGDAS